MMAWMVGGALALLFGTAMIVLRRRGRHRLRATLHASWGQPRERQRDMPAIASYHEERCSRDGVAPAVDDRTWADLELTALFAELDRTESAVGRQLLYHRLRREHADDELAAFDATVERLRTDAAARERVRVALARLDHADAYDLWRLATPGAVEVRAWHVLYPVLGLAALGLAIAAVVQHALLLGLVGLLLLNAAVRAATDRRRGAVLAPMRQLGALLAAADTLAALEGPGLDTTTAALRAELPRLARLRRIARWVGRDPFVAGELAASAHEYFNLLLLVDANALFFAAGELRRHGDALRRVLHLLGDLDAAQSVASVRCGMTRWTAPAFQPAGAPLRMVELVHPLLEAAVPNSVELAAGEGVVITGSNMSGKSTFLRTVGAAVVLAQSIATVPAVAYAAPRLVVRSCIGRSDDLLAGKSYYVAEVEAVLRMVREAATGVPHLFLFDELFRGTNTVERVAAGEAVLRTLLETPRDGAAAPHVVLVATHDLELVTRLGDEYRAAHFAESVDDHGLRFDYRLRDGRAMSRNAIALLRLHGAPPALVERATHSAAELGSWGQSR